MNNVYLHSDFCRTVQLQIKDDNVIMHFFLILLKYHLTVNNVEIIYVIIVRKRGVRTVLYMFPFCQQKLSRMLCGLLLEPGY